MAGRPIIVITIDVDWAPDEVLADTLELLDAYNVRATLFATHATALLNETPHEIAIHPNFLKRDRPENDIITELLSIFPSARGVRCHALYSHSRIAEAYHRDYGLIYQSNYLLYMQPHIRPVRLFDIIEMPIFFADDFHLRMWTSPAGKFWPEHWSMLATSGLKIFDFHPIHVFLNTQRLMRYTQIKNRYQEPDALRPFVNNGEGTRTFLERLLRFATLEGWPMLTMIEVSEAFRESVASDSFLWSGIEG